MVAEDQLFPVERHSFTHSSQKSQTGPKVQVPTLIAMAKTYLLGVGFVSFSQYEVEWTSPDYDSEEGRRAQEKQHSQNICRNVYLGAI